MRRLGWIFLAMIGLWGCRAPVVQPTAVSIAATPVPSATAKTAATAEAAATVIQETAVPTPTPMPTLTPLPTSEPPPTAVPTPETIIVSGQTAEGAFFYGNPDAPVTLLDYSDFL